ncbi:MAG: patatin-like phospholipase family protein [Cyclobacteriaceae bacterium]|nr:patatin-like phospholipase family protein [Cyclobacteriaceae bacterium]
MDKLKQFTSNFYYWLPVRLFLRHLRKNQILLLSWIILFMIITGNFGRFLGINYLFLDPEYLNKVSFISFMWVGAALAGLTTAYHITCYIIDGHRFTFIGTISKPFTTFSLNNNFLPLAFLFTYIILLIKYQLSNKGTTVGELTILLLGLLVGYLIMSGIFYIYFLLTNKDIFKYVVCKVDEKLKEKVPAARAGAMKKLNIARKEQIKVTHYLKPNLKISKVIDHKGFYDRSTILQVFDQNHFNLVVIELLIFIIMLILGIFRYNPYFQIPAAASFILFVTVLVMFAGAFSYWFNRWSITAFLAIFLLLNYSTKQGFLLREYQAFGLDYTSERVEYNLNTIKQTNSIEQYKTDTTNTINILNKWRAKFPKEEKPKIVFTCVSGGGQRAALWAFTALQYADSLTKGKLMKHTTLITGASGGMIGAAYFRELMLRNKSYKLEYSPYASYHQYNLAKDNLNSIIFSLLVNDFFIGGLKYDYLGFRYSKDRGYAFEKQLELNTGGILNKSISEYWEPENEAIIPMLIMAPTIINDGRKLFIGAQNVSYMAADPNMENWYGVDFLRLFENQKSDNLSFYSALRMNAAFPYITPNVTLPSNPPLEIMDAGIIDNFGISDAVRFLHVFKDWIYENTSGVLILSIRDSKKELKITNKKGESIIEKFSTPLSNIYNNFEKIQNLNNDAQVQHARSWFKGDLEQIIIEYDPALNLKTTDRASLNWRLTEKEKNSVLENIDSKINQEKIEKLKMLLN